MFKDSIPMIKRMLFQCGYAIKCLKLWRTLLLKPVILIPYRKGSREVKDRSIRFFPEGAISYRELTNVGNINSPRFKSGSAKIPEWNDCAGNREEIRRFKKLSSFFLCIFIFQIVLNLFSKKYIFQLVLAIEFRKLLIQLTWNLYTMFFNKLFTM